MQVVWRDLNKEHASQLFRYFASTNVRFCVLTNGIIYRFYTDLDKENIMDEKPFLEFNMLDIKDTSIIEIKKFSKTSFELDGLIKTARKLRYMGEIRSIFENEMANPSDDFVRFFATRVYNKGKLVQSVKEEFSELIKITFKQLVNDKINDRLKSALVKEEQAILETPDSEQPVQTERERSKKIVTTEEEIQGYNTVKSILEGSIDSDRINIRDTINFCGVLLDDNQQKPICKLYFNEPQKYLGLFDDKKNEFKVKIDAIEDINKYADKLKATVEAYDSLRVEPEENERTKINFTFGGNEYEARYWKDFYLQICSLMAANHKDRFDDILQISGRKHPHFSKNPGNLRLAKQIEGTDIYAEVGFGAKYLEGLSRKVIKLFGYDAAELKIK